MTIEAMTTITTVAGPVVVRYHEAGTEQCLTLTYGTLAPAQPTLVRLHSACLFGEVFGSTACDCGPQLHAALHAIVAQGSGVIVYLFQEGRGIGLKAKIQPLDLQRQGLTTVAAMRALGFDPDPRTYAVAITALHDLGISHPIDLMSNNPRKRGALEAGGFSIGRMVPLTYQWH